MLDTNVHYEVVSFSVGDTKAGTKMGKLQLKNVENETVLNCILWEEALNRMDIKLFRVGNIVRIVSGNYNEKFNNTLINSLELIQEAKMGLDKEEIEDYFSQICGYIEKIKDKKLKEFVSSIIEKNEKAIKISPAAKTMHHNYLGGLLVHTLECLKIADANFPVFEKPVNRDNVYAACILHDIGKIFEYEIEEESGVISYNEEFKREWITHTQYAYSICMTNGFVEVARMIAAHHSRSDWGAIIDLSSNDLEPSIYLIHHIDDLSAKFGKTSVNML